MPQDAGIGWVARTLAASLWVLPTPVKQKKKIIKTRLAKYILLENQGKYEGEVNWLLILPRARSHTWNKFPLSAKNGLKKKNSNM